MMNINYNSRGTKQSFVLSFRCPDRLESEIFQPTEPWTLSDLNTVCWYTVDATHLIKAISCFLMDFLLT